MKNSLQPQNMSFLSARGTGKWYLINLGSPDKILPSYLMELLECLAGRVSRVQMKKLSGTPSHFEE